MADLTEAEQQQLKAEFTKLGANAEARIVAVQDFIAAQVGHDLAPGIIKDLTRARHVEAFEKMMANTRAQQRAAATAASVSAPSPQHREPPQEPGRVDEATFSKMSARERIEYTRQFDQSRFTNGGGR